jgi:hypothetical protein
MRLRIAFETFVASSTFPSSSALVNHQPSPKPGKLRPRPTWSTQECAVEEKMQITSLLRIRTKFCSSSDRRIPFFSQGIFFRGSKNKIHFFLVDFKAGF